MISQMFFVTNRGDVIMNRDFRQDLPKDTPAVFFRKFKLEGDELSPIFQDRGVNFFYLNCDHFCIVATSGHNACPAMAQTILYRIRNVLSDLIGVLDEKSLR